MTKIILTFGIVIGLILQWATTNVCRYNFTIDKKTQALKIISEDRGEIFQKYLAGRS